ncbi:GntR family transcriptional regulator [Prauserella marina]|uniref:GntR family transcriptional regulator n=1 Tax=Prauserella marina TaxID=530584 RepID=A0A222VVK1_9PSEU|nr:GntR family transcriptional regulator [Prauserella marina]ASR37959.1 GntR family transcriptional regulator [Prauserella marina]PWV73181.1 GntR family transcriptional regulator [Prauserella marina]SDD69971.1 GntR family transcriptional regulator [Prauserella marina]
MAIGYRELAAVLRDEIHAGKYQPGDTLPKQDELAAQYDINVNTVRKAVGVLEAEGLVTAVRRRGTVVRSRPPMKRLGTDRYAKSKWKFGLVAFAADREASGQSWKRDDQTNTVRKAVADNDIATALGVESGSEVYERARLVKQGGQPTHTLTSYYRPEHVEGTPIVDPRPGTATPGGGFAVLTLQGLEPDHMTETFHARMPTPEEIEVLELPAGEPVVVLHRTTFTAQDEPVEFAVGIHAASRFAWTYNFTIPD